MLDYSGLSQSVQDAGSASLEGQIAGQKMRQSNIELALRQSQSQRADVANNIQVIKMVKDTYGPQMAQLRKKGDVDGLNNLVASINSNPNLKPALDAFGFSGLEFGKVGGKVTSKLPIKITEENIKSMPKGTNVQVGDTGKGELDSNGNILSFEKTDVANKKKDGQAQIILDNNVRILSDIDNFLADPDLSKATGMSGFVTGSIPGGKAYTTRAKLKTLQAQQAFGALQEMRQASATGASGLGQVSERELSLLESTIASLDPNISDEAFVENLNKFKNELTRINSRIYSERPDLSPTPLVQGASQQGSFNQNAIQQSLPDENPPSTNERDPLGIF